MKAETIEFLRSLVNAEAKRPGSGAAFNNLIDALRELDAAAAPPLCNVAGCEVCFRDREATKA